MLSTLHGCMLAAKICGGIRRDNHTAGTGQMLHQPIHIEDVFEYTAEYDDIVVGEGGQDPAVEVAYNRPFTPIRDVGGGVSAGGREKPL